MNFAVILWIVQIIFALLFLMAGAMKAFQPKEKLAEKMAWVQDFSGGQIRLIGILEILGALGLILPVATGILPWLTPLAAVGLSLTMVGAAYTHLRRNETGIMVNVVLLLGAAFVAYAHYFIV